MVPNPAVFMIIFCCLTALGALRTHVTSITCFEFILLKFFCSKRHGYIVFEVYILHNVVLCGFLGWWAVINIYDSVYLTTICKYIVLWSLALKQFIREYASI
jgi:hypothetical protein